MPITKENQIFLEKKCKFPPQDFKSVFLTSSDLLIDLIKSLLIVNPTRRPSATEALNHPYLFDAEVFYDYSKNYIKKPSNDYFAFEMEKTSLGDLKEMIIDEIKLCQINPLIPTKGPISVIDNNRSPFEGDAICVRTPSTVSEDSDAIPVTDTNRDATSREQKTISRNKKNNPFGKNNSSGDDLDGQRIRALSTSSNCNDAVSDSNAIKELNTEEKDVLGDFPFDKPCVDEVQDNESVLQLSILQDVVLEEKVVNNDTKQHLGPKVVASNSCNCIIA